MSQPHHLRYRVCDQSVELEVGDAALLEPLGVLFPDYEADAGAPVTDDVLRLSVAASGDRFAVIDPLGACTECATLTQLLDTCEFALTQVFLAGCGEFAQLHASGAVVAGGAVLALGRAGAGKSSLALSWHRMGYPALGDDIVLLDDRGHAHPFKRLFGLEAATLQQLGVAPEETCLWEPGSQEVWYDPRAGAGWGGPAPVALVAVAAFRPGAALTITPLSRSAALNALVHSQFAGTGDRPDRLEALAHVAEHAQAFEVTFGSSPEAAAALAARAA
jgi:hypothetical protein